jgi:hypothetical protein
MNRTRSDRRGLIALALTCAVGTGCARDDNASSTPVSGSPTDAAMPSDEDLPALPTVEEAQQQALDEIDEENLDDAMRRLEAELDADVGDDG